MLFRHHFRNLRFVQKNDVTSEQLATKLRFDH